MSKKKKPSSGSAKRKYVRIPQEVYWVFDAVADDSQIPSPTLIREVLIEGLVSAGVLDESTARKDTTAVRKRRSIAGPSGQQREDGTVMLKITPEIHSGLAMLAERRLTNVATEARLILVAYLEREGLWPIEEE